MAKLRIALASLRHPPSVDQGVDRIMEVLHASRRRRVQIVCTSEAYLPGLRKCPDTMLPPDQKLMERALAQLRSCCRENRVAAIIGMEWVSKSGLQNRGVVISPAGRVLGHQTKNQITPGSESRHYVADGRRRVFRMGKLVFGIVICHEGWRYPETVRWAATRGAHIVFQPQFTGAINAINPAWGAGSSALPIS